MDRTSDGAHLIGLQRIVENDANVDTDNDAPTGADEENAS